MDAATPSADIVNQLSGHKGGLPLARARHCFVEPHLWKAEMIAMRKRASPSLPNKLSPGSPWRYEVLAVPSDPPPQESWSSWEAQQANPLYKAEAEYQNAFFAVSLELGRRLIMGELRAFGRVGSIVGAWTAMPALAWRGLRVPHSFGLASWRDGHVIGGGAEFWDVVILDTVGLPLSRAMAAYGSARAAWITARAIAFGIAPAAAEPRSALDRRIMNTEQPSISPSGRPRATELAGARAQLEADLLSLLRNGVLQATGVECSGAPVAIATAAWKDGTTDFDQSTLTQPSGAILSDVLILQNAETSTVEADAGENHSKPSRDRPRLPKASEQDILDAVRRVYRDHSPPPNVARMWALVDDDLAGRELHATKARVQEIGDRPEFASKRGKPGVRLSTT